MVASLVTLALGLAAGPLGSQVLHGGRPVVRAARLGRHAALIHSTAARTVAGDESLADDLAVASVSAHGIAHTLGALWNFTRPHTLVGSAICIPALHMFAAPVGVALPLRPLLESIAFVLLPSLLINVYIVGLNQVLDVEADRINKPYLPLAKGDFTVVQGIAISVACLVGGLGLGCLLPSALSSPALRGVLLGSVALGTAYSLPPLRLKRFPLFAGLCITSVRGALVNWGFFTHASRVVYGVADAALNPRCVAATAFYMLFGVVIALLKDVPDVAGDRAVGISTFSIQFGRQRIFNLATGALQAAFGAVALALLGAVVLSSAADPAVWPALAGWRILGAGIAAAFAGIVRTLAGKVDVADPKAVYAFYMKCWGLFYASYAGLWLCR